MPSDSAVKEISREVSSLPSLIALSKSGEWLDVADQEIGDPKAGAGDGDICDIEDRPIRKLDEVHDVTVKELWLSKDPIGEVAKHASKERSEPDCPTRFYDPSREDDESGGDDQGEDGEEDREVGTNIECGTTVRGVIEAQKLTKHIEWFSLIKVCDRPPLGGLIETEQ